MLKIAICDDHLSELTTISNLLNAYKAENTIPLKYETFQSALDLLESMKTQGFDIIFLDILMPGLDGMSTAREIRKLDSDVKIIFLTSSVEYAVDSYAVNAYYYLIKPLTPEKLFPLLNGILVNTERNKATLTLKTPSKVINILLNQLEVLEKLNRKLVFHLTDGTSKEISGTLAAYEHDLLCYPQFLKVHRSYIVNMDYIEEMDKNTILTYSKQNVPISRLIHSDVKSAYMRYLFEDEAIHTIDDDHEV